MTTSPRVLQNTTAALIMALLVGAWPRTSTADSGFLRTEATQTFSPLTNGTPVVFTDGDNGSTLVALGFAFEFYGHSYSHVNVSANGGLIPALPCTATSSAVNQCPGGLICGPANACTGTLPPVAPSQSPAVPPGSTRPPVIAALWDDLLTTPGQVTYGFEGVSPNRKFVLQWSQVQLAPVSASHATFQIKLEETLNGVEFHYGSYGFVTAEIGSWMATMGIQDSSGGDQDVPFPCAETNSCNGYDLNAISNKVVRWAIPQGPELAAKEAQPSNVPRYGGVGDTVYVPFVIRNLGLTVTPTSVDYEIRLTGTSTALFARGTLAPIAAGAEVTATATASLPALPAAYYSIEVVVDPNSRIQEVTRANNSVVLKRNFLLGSELSAVIVAPAILNPGDVVTFDVRLTNLGASHPTVPLEIHLSSSRTPSATAPVIYHATYAVPPNGFMDIEMAFEMPAHPTGSYFAVISIDIPDAQPGNNQTAAATSSLVLGPDLVVQLVSTPAAMAVHGEALQVDATLENVEDGGAMGFEVRAFFADDQSCTGPVHLLPDNGLSLELGARRTLNISHTYRVPSSIPTGNYYLCLSANPDLTMPEDNLTTSNTRACGSPIEVSRPLPDFAVRDLQVPSLIAGGESMVLHRTLLNLSEDSNTMDYRVYLSTDNSLDPTQDCLLDTWGRANTFECQTQGFSTRPYVPHSEVSDVDRAIVPTALDPGQYYIIYSLDPENSRTELDEDNNIAWTGPITLIAPGLQIFTEELPLGITDAPYDTTLNVRGHSNTPTFTTIDDSLPEGLELSESGRLHGTPTGPGDFELVITVFDLSSHAQKSLTLTIIDPTTELQVATRSLPPALIGITIETPLIALGGTPPYTWHVLTGTTPPGLTLDEQGWLRGAATEASVATIEVLVQDRFEQTAEARLVVRAVTADGSVRWSSSMLPDGQVDAPYEHDVGPEPGTGVGPYVYELVLGELPAGLTINGDCGRLICGTPNQSGEYSFDLQISDSIGHFDVNRYFVGITDQRFDLATTSLPDAVLGEPYETIIATIAGSSATFAVLNSPAPAGLLLAADGTLSGIPTTPGLTAFTVVAQSQGQSAYAAYSLNVVQTGALPPPTLVHAAEEKGCRCIESSGTSPMSIVLLGLLLLGFRKMRPGAVLLLLMVCPSSPAQAQSAQPYTIQSESAPYAHISEGTSLTFHPNADDGDALVDLPFVFPFYGRNYTQIRVSSNGFIALGTTSATSYENREIPASAAPNGLIAPWWDDLVATDTSTLTIGQRPNRTFVIQYAAVTKAGVANAGQFQFQVLLFENRAGQFDVHYGPFVGSSVHPSTYSASCGFEDTTGTHGSGLLGCPISGCDASDLIVATDSIVHVRPDLGPDIMAVEILAPTNAVGAQSIDLDVVLESFAGTQVGPTQYSLHLLARGSTASLSNEIYRSQPLIFQPFERKAFTVPVTIPSDATQGSYTFAMVADTNNEVEEYNENNNAIVTDVVTRVRAAAPNFRVSGVSAPAQVDFDGRLTVTFTVENTGSVGGTVPWSIQLSSNRVVSASDRPLYGETQFLDVNEAMTLRPTLPMPTHLPPGRYWVGVVLDALDMVPELDELDNTAVSQQIRVLGDVVGAHPQSAPRGYLGLNYFFDLKADGGDGLYEWSVVAGSQLLPAGLRLEGDRIVGTPELIATSTVTFEVRSDGRTAQIDHIFRITEAVEGLTIVTRDFQPGVAGAAYGTEGQGVVAVGASGQVRFHVETSGLVSATDGCGTGGLITAGPPAGLTLDPAGLLFGTPQAVGDFELLVVATDDRMQTERCLKLTVGEAGRLTLVADSLPEARLCERYFFQLRAIGSSTTTAPSFMVNAPDSAPAGLSLEASGAIRGQPTHLGRSRFVVGVSDGTDHDTAGFLLNVVPCAERGLTPTTIPEAQVGVPYHIELVAEGLGPDPTWTIAGAPFYVKLDAEGLRPDGSKPDPKRLLPPGLGAYPIGETGLYSIDGKPTMEGLALFLVQAKDDAGRTAQFSYTLKVNKAAPPPPVEEGCQCTSAGGLSSAWLLWGLLVFLPRRRSGRKT